MSSQQRVFKQLSMPSIDVPSNQVNGLQSLGVEALDSLPFATPRL